MKLQDAEDNQLWTAGRLSSNIPMHPGGSVYEKTEERPRNP